MSLKNNLFSTQLKKKPEQFIKLKQYNVAWCLGSSEAYYLVTDLSIKPQCLLPLIFLDRTRDYVLRHTFCFKSLFPEPQGTSNGESWSPS